MSPHPEAQETLYDKYGGEDTIRALVEEFYTRVLSDGELAPFFQEVDMGRLKRHQALFISQALGGPKQYDGREMTEAHQGLNITGAQFEAVAGHLHGALSTLDVEAEDIQAILEVVGSLREQVVAPPVAVESAQAAPAPMPTARGLEHLHRWLRAS